MAGLTAHATEGSVVLETVAVNCWACEALNESKAGVMATDSGVVLGAALTDTAAFAELCGSATLDATTLTDIGAFGAAGAVYKPAGEIVPTDAVPPAIPFTVQATLVSVEPLTDAVNCWLWPGRSFTNDGDVRTFTG